MNENMDHRAVLLVKWLRVLIYIAVVSIINSVIGIMPFLPASITTWIGRGIMAAMIVCMLQMAPVNERYKKAGILRAVMLGCTLVTAFLHASSILTLVASILSIIAVYQEYNAHAELAADKDAELSRKWHSLFNWSIAAGILVGFGSVAAVLIVAMLEMDAVKTTSFIVGLLGVPQLVIDIVYLLYLNKMTAIFGESEVQ